MSAEEFDDDYKNEDLFSGGEFREGYDSYAIYDPSTKKRTGRYISKTPAAAAMKAARRLFKTGKKAAAKKTKKGGDGDATSMENFAVPPGALNCASATDGINKNTCYANPSKAPCPDLFAFKDNIVNKCAGGAKSADLFKKETKNVKFLLRKTTRGAMGKGKRVFYYFSATLKTYKTPLVVMRGGVRVTIKHKIFVESLELPAEIKRMMEERKAAKKASKGDVTAKRAAAKAKKEAAKEKAREKKAAAKARKEAAKEAKKAAKAAKAAERKAAKASKKSKASKKPKATKKPKAAKRSRTAKMTGGGSCSMNY